MKKAVFEIVSACLSLLLLLAFGSAVAKAQQHQAQFTLPGSGLALFNPLPNRYAIVGRVLNQQNEPLAGVTVRTNRGHIAVTDGSGVFTIKNLPAGSYTLTPSQGGTKFSPSSAAVVVQPGDHMLNFTGNVQYFEAAMVTGGLRWHSN